MICDSDSPLFSFAIIADSHITDEEGLAIDGSHRTGKKVTSMYCDLIERVNIFAARERRLDRISRCGATQHPTRATSIRGSSRAPSVFRTGTC